MVRWTTAAALGLALAACSGGGSETTTPPGGSGTQGDEAEEAGPTERVAVDHPATGIAVDVPTAWEVNDTGAMFLAAPRPPERDDIVLLLASLAPGELALPALGETLHLGGLSARGEPETWSGPGGLRGQARSCTARAEGLGPVDVELIELESEGEQARVMVLVAREAAAEGRRALLREIRDSARPSEAEAAAETAAR